MLSAAIAVLTGATALLAWASPRPPSGITSPPALLSWLGALPPYQAVSAVAALGAWVCVAWLAVAVTATVLATVPGRLGRLAATISRQATPEVLRRCVQAALGLAVTTACTGLPAGAAAADASRPHPPVAAGVAGSRPNPSDAASNPTGPRLDWPTAESRAGAGRPAPPSPQPVVVQVGDTLWAIAARQLGPGATDSQIAASWPRWYATNRPLLGAGPDLLFPGQRLVPPS